MATKAKKKIHPMPKLGWEDQLLYWTAMVLTGGFSILGTFIVLLAQDDIAFSDPAVIARTVGQGNLYFITALCSLCSHDHNRSIAPIKANFIVALDRLLLIDYCITNPAVIK